MIRQVLDAIDMPKPRKRGGRGGAGGGGGGGRPSRADNPVPGHYRPVEYGSTHESRLVQQARLDANDRNGLYGAATWRGEDGVLHEGIGRANKNRHAEEAAMDDLRARIAAHEGVTPDQVNLRDRDGVNIYAEYSPCDTLPRDCQEMIRQTAPNADVTYSWPWNPRDVRDSSREARQAAVDALLARGSVGPI